ncbi:MAG: DUF4157 domain-containing protein [Acidobacteria bacterium]|nr:DUF4157 domain-containing protein [Acidobacteriota bacterium]
MTRQKIIKTNQEERQKKTQPSAKLASTLAPGHSLLQLQQMLGNQAVGRFLQAKLEVNQPGDRHEEEADRVADMVMRMPEPGPLTPPNGSSSSMQRKCAACASGQGLCPKCAEEERLERKPVASPITHFIQRQVGLEPEEEESLAQTKKVHSSAPLVSHSVENYVNSIRGSGQPLSQPVRAYLEPRFGYDFSEVRVHTDSRAAESARKVNAQAYTVGRDIVFGARQYDPETDQGRRLLAHELTHTLQQTPVAKVRRRRLSGIDEEQEEKVMAKEDSTGAQKLMRFPATAESSPVTPVTEKAYGLALQRAEEDEPLEEEAEKITERSEEKTWSKTSPGLTEQDKPNERFLLMNFGINKAELKKEHEDFLKNTVFYGTLTSDPMAKITIVGHADQTGPKKFNERLSKKRAKEVEKKLKEWGRHSIRIETVAGKGFEAPIADNKKVYGRARNRRVEILATPFKPNKPVPELLTELQSGMAPYVFKVNNFSAAPFQDTIKRIVEEAYKPVSLIKFDWEGKSADAEGWIDFDDSTEFQKALGLSGDIYLKSFMNNEICRDEGDPSTCEKVFPKTAEIMGRAIANTVAHEAGHRLALDHVPGTDNYMWSPELHPLFSKKGKTFDDKVLLQRTLQAVTAKFNDSQLVHMVNRIKEQRKERKEKPGVIEFE